MRELVEHVWFGDDVFARVARAALVPSEVLYRASIGMREMLYDTGLFTSHDPVIPAVSVGNVTVGGTGKTPVAAWIAAELAERGARPAIVLRGYGEDEPLVHARLNPDVPVIVAADRVAGIVQARDGGATIAVLDDAFQHRQVSREADIVLVSADRWSPTSRLLPAGPLREPLAALGRATIIVVTRKAATDAEVGVVNESLAEIAPRVPRSTVRLSPEELRSVTTSPAAESRRPITDVEGRRVRLLTAIGDPRAFVKQIEMLGATVTSDIYPDHHDFQSGEIARFVRSVPSDGLAVCTLKDAVKIGDQWPREAPTLWYVSQRVSVERGVGGVEHILDDLTRVPAPARRER
ncbi:MAG TPA: tetraacyldisaccharide 4'-kinase [Gemmatimonadaceae bacterium]|nr:tetraacyldisaccharide 4'-kinase [Gemmatimonadaceae bacterium]